MGTEDDIGTGRGKGTSQPHLPLAGAGLPFDAPVEGNDHDVGLGTRPGDDRPETFASRGVELSAKVQGGDARSLRPGGATDRHRAIGNKGQVADECYTWSPVEGEDRGGLGLGLVLASACGTDAGPPEERSRLSHPCGSEVHRVIVAQGEQIETSGAEVREVTGVGTQDELPSRLEVSG